MIWRWLFALLATLALVVPALAQGVLRKVPAQLDPTKAYVVVETGKVDDGLLYGTLIMSRYDRTRLDIAIPTPRPPGHKGKWALDHRLHLIKPFAKSKERQLILAEFEPGLWVIEGANDTAFSLGSSTIELAPGTVTDLGVAKIYSDCPEGDKCEVMSAGRLLKGALLGGIFGSVMPPPMPKAVEFRTRGPSDMPLPPALANLARPVVFGDEVRFGNHLGGLINRMGGRKARPGVAPQAPVAAPAPPVAQIAPQGGEVARRLVTIPEGMPSIMVHDLLMAQPDMTGEIAVPAEGSVLPDSYDFQSGESRQALLLRMQERMTSVLQEAWAKRGADSAVKTPEEALILASIVEKEAGKPAERGMVAGLFTNRLKRGFLLQADSTIIYPITKGKPLGRRITMSEMQAVNDYNTYSMVGLPKGPITNPGKAAIEAALNPAKTDVVYMVADGTGGHVFARTLEEHNRNVEKWYAIRRERGDM